MTADPSLLDWFRTRPQAATQAVRHQPAQPLLTRADLASANADQRERLLTNFLRHGIGRVLNCPTEAVDCDQTMTDLGIGSMGGLELHSFITSALGTAPTLPTILSAENLRVLARRVEGVLA